MKAKVFFCFLISVFFISSCRESSELTRSVHPEGWITSHAEKADSSGTSICQGCHPPDGTWPDAPECTHCHPQDF